MSNELDIAIVGMAGRFPGARNIEEYWCNLRDGVESITRLSDEDILQTGVSRSYLSDSKYVKAAPLLDDAESFDAAFFGFSPMEAKGMDPQHRILLELAYEALEHAGYDPHRYPGRVGVFTGAAFNTYFLYCGLSGGFAEEYIPTLIGSDKDFLSTRISYKLNLKGPSITVQTACSTAMVAVHLARQSLLSEETDMALAGGISVRVPQRAGYLCDGGGVLSPDGHVRAFDAKANGTVFGSGGGILVLKRLADAISDGDTIYAVIKGSAINNDGSEKAGYTAPSVNSQADAVVEALANAGVEADSISYVEAHGSGTPVGDPIEVRALTKAFRTSTQRSGYCAIGSVKTNVGHLDAAAAVAGIIKTVLALKHRQIPPSLHFHEANPEIDFPHTPFYVNTRLQDWTSDGPRRAGLLSTGMGGTNACTVLEEAPEAADLADDRPPHLLILSAKTEKALDQSTDQMREFLNRGDQVSMAEIAHTLRVGRQARPYRRFLVCAGREDAVAVLGDAHSKRLFSGEAPQARRPLVFLFPGIGDHYVGMAHDLYESCAVFREEVDRCAGILIPYLGIDIRTVLYPRGEGWKKEAGASGIDLRKMLGRVASSTEDSDARTLNQTQFAQPAVFTIEYALARFWQSLGVTPDAIVGHSMGEYVAACLAGVLSLDDALGLIAARARLVSELPQGAMLAVMLSEDELMAILPGDLSISLINGPGLCVVAGPMDVIAEFERTLNERGIICRRVQNSHAFHSRMLDPIVKDFEKQLKGVRWNAPTIPYIANVTGTWITRNDATNPAYWARHATQTARFSDALRALWQLDNPILLEVGPGRTLGTLALQHPARSREEKPAAVSSLRHHYEGGSDVGFFWHSVGMLWLYGVDIKWENLYSGQHRRRVPLPTYPFERQRYWMEPARAPDAPSRADESVQKNSNCSEWFYVPSWKRVLPRGSGAHHIPSRINKTRPWLFYADACGLGAALAARLKDAGHDVVTVKAGAGFEQLDDHTFVIEPSNPRHHEELIRALREGASLPDRIVHGWSLTGNDTTQSSSDGFRRAQESGFYSLLFLARALASHNAGRQIELVALSNHTQEVLGTEILCPEKSTLQGLCLVIGQEYPNVRLKHIDLDFPHHIDDVDWTADSVLGEFLDPDSSLFVAYRNGHRWAQTFEPVRFKDRVEPRPAFRQGGVYVITGGLGKVGIAICEYLASKYRARLVLVGRAHVPERASWKAWLNGGDGDESVRVRIRAIEKIEQLGGEVLYVDANVADESAMRLAVEGVYERFGALHGVIHGAGIVGDKGYREIKDCTCENCDGHFQAKAHGVLVIEKVLDGKPLDFCLLLSSLASVLGGLGQAAYSSSNIYMDTFARKHNRSSSVPWLSVNWDVWRVQDHAAIDSGLGTTLKDLGMTAEEATAMMETLLAMNSTGQIVVSTGSLGARINQWIRMESLHGRDPAVSAAAIPSAHSEGDEIEQRVARIWRDTLGIQEVGIHDNFGQLGGHSLLAIRIVTELRNAFQIDLPVRALFEAPTVAQLSRYIKDQIIAEVGALTEEEAQRLVFEGP